MIVTQSTNKSPTLADPCVACNVWPNPPWNTVAYEWDGSYPECSPEWFAQKMAKFALAHGTQYTTENRYAQYEKPGTAQVEQVQKEVKSMPTKPIAQAEQDEMQVRNGVCDDKHLYMMHEGKLFKKQLPAIKHAGDLLQLCLDAGLETLWILPQTEISDRASHDFIEYPEVTGSWKINNAQYTEAEEYEDGIARCTFVMAWKHKEARAQQDSGRAICLGYAEHNIDWGLSEVENPVHLLGAITYLEDACGYPIRFKPNTYGKRVMKEVNTGERLPWVRPVNLSECTPVFSTKIIDMRWKRPLTQTELGKSHLIGADKNSEYPASCTSVLLGAGQPTYEEFPTFDLKKPLPGVYHCHLKPSTQSEFDGVQLPHPTDGAQEGWFWTYTVKLLFELGYNPTITEAYVWPWAESHTTLRPWAEKLWNARASLDDSNPLCNVARYPSAIVRKLAYNAVKPVLNTSLGLLDHLPQHTGYVGSTDWYRPDWYALLKDNARYQMFWRIRSVVSKIGVRPIGVLADCLYYIVDTNDHLTALPGMFDRWDKLGGYKRKYKKEITVPQVADLFGNTALDMGQVNQALLNYDNGKSTLVAKGV